MIIKNRDYLLELLELANNYPSPHNGQPIRVRPVSENRFDLYFENSRGLRGAEISYIFSFVSMGVFAEHLARSAEALGHELELKLDLPKEQSLHDDGAVRFAKCSISWASGQRDALLTRVIRSRQTSRKKYYEGIDADIARKVTDLAKNQGMRLVQLDQNQVHQAIWLNQRAVFDDMFDVEVRKELDQWLRYNKKQKYSFKDGLSYDCMEINGVIMKSIVKFPWILRTPGMSRLLKSYYLRTMKDDSSVFYMTAPFGSEMDAYEVGEVIVKMWLSITRAGGYIHPFGTIMSNDQAHHDFIDIVGEKNESRGANYLVFIFRAGKSEIPVGSLRLGVKDHLLWEE